MRRTLRTPCLWVNSPRASLTLCEVGQSNDVFEIFLENSLPELSPVHRLPTDLVPDYETVPRQRKRTDNWNVAIDGIDNPPVAEALAGLGAMES